MQYNRNVLNAVLRRDLASFVQKSFQTLLPGERYIPAPYIRVITNSLDQAYRGELRRLIITMPPRYMKSICASVVFPAWVLGKDPTRKIVCVSYAHDLARKHAGDFRNIVQADWYREVFPAMRIRRDTEAEFVTSKHGYRLATSVGGTLTGRGGNIIIIDDPIKPTDAASQTTREAANEWYDNTLRSRLNNQNEDVIIIVMQRLHADDLVGHVLGLEDWTVVNLPAIAEHEERYPIGENLFFERAPGDLLNPDRESRETLENLRRNMGSILFAAQYQQNPIPEQGNLVKREWLKTYETAPFREDFDSVVQSWDTAAVPGAGNDYSVGLTFGVIGQDYYLIDVCREQLDFPDLRKRVIAEARKHHADTILIEDMSAGIGLIQDLRKTTSWRPIACSPDGDKMERLAVQSAKIEAGQLLLPERAAWLDAFVQELLQFPNGRHDDQVDALTQFLAWKSRRRNIEYVRGEPVIIRRDPVRRDPIRRDPVRRP